MANTGNADLSRLKRLLAAIFVALAVALTAGALIYHWHHRNSLRADAERMLLSLEQIKLQQLQSWREERGNTVLSLLDGQPLHAYLRAFAADPSDKTAEAALRGRLRAFIARNKFQFAALAGPDGRALLHTGGRPEAMGPGLVSLLARAKASGRPELGEFYLHSGEAAPHIDIVTRVPGISGGRALFLLLRLDPSEFLYPLLQTWSGRGETGEILLVGRDGEELVFLNDLRHVPGAAMRLRRPLNDETLPAAMGLRGATGIVEGRDYRGVQVLAAVGPVPGTSWAMVTKVDLAEVLKGSGALGAMLLLLVVALLAAAGAGAYLLLMRQAAAYERIRINYDLFSEKANDGILVVDMATRTVLEANRRACEMYGYPPERMKGLKAETVIPPADREVFEKRLAESVSAGGRVYEVNHLRSDGTLFPAEISSSIVEVSGKSTMFVIVRDVTERRNSEALLKTVNERFLLAARAAGLGVWDWNVADNRLAWDDRMFELYGVSRESSPRAYENWLRGLHPGDRERCERETALALKGEKAYDTEFRVLLPGGSVRYLRAVADVFRDASGKPVRMVGVNQDVTESRLAAQKLQESQERLRVALDETRIGIWEWDVAEDVWLASATYYTMLGYEPETGPANRAVWLERVHPEDRDGVAARIRGVMDGGDEKYQYEARIRHADGGYRWQLVLGTVVKRAADGRPARLMGVRMDITERRRNEEINSARLRLLQYAASHTLDELLEETLNEAEKLTDSRIGFYHFVNEDQRTLTLQTWSTATKAKFCKAAGKGRHYAIDEAGVWVECFYKREPVIHNDYAALPDKKGLPAGHAAVNRELVVPVLRDGKVRSVLGVGNKTSLYGAEDVKAVSLLADLAWEIAERKLAEEALRKSEKDLKGAQRLARLGNWTLDLTSNKLEWSEEIFRIFEIDPSQFGASYEAFLGLVHPEDREAVNKAYAGSLKTRKPYDIVHRLLMKDGRVKYVSEFCETVYDAAGTPLRSVGTVQDITERKRAEEALRKSENAVRNKLNAIMSPEGDIGSIPLEDIFDVPALQRMMDDIYQLTHITSAILDINGKVLVASGWQDICTKFHRVNPETCRHCLESDTTLSRDIPPGEFRSYFCKNNMRDVATPLIVGGAHVGNFFLGQFLYDDDPRDREKFREQARRYGFDEEEYLAAYDRIPVFSHRNVEALIGFYRQVSELISTLSYGRIKLARALAQSKQAEQEKERLNLALAAKNSEMENFLYITTHDLRSPLVNIQGFSQNLQRYFGEITGALAEAGLPQERKERVRELTSGKVPEALGFVLESSAKMDALISALLKVSRLGRQELKPEQLEMGKLLSRIVDTMLFQVREAGAEIRVGPLPPCRADAASVTQLFSNLLDNAVKYRDAGRSLVVEVSGENRGGVAVYRVTDNGPGIPETEYQKLWSVFYKPAGAGKKNGEGIGLPLCRRIAELNGGSIRVEPALGGGSVFVVELPAARLTEGT